VCHSDLHQARDERAEEVVVRSVVWVGKAIVGSLVGATKFIYKFLLPVRMIGEAFVPPKVFYGFLVAAVLIGVALAVFRFWRGGVALRATASDQQAAYSMGIDVPKVFSLSWTVAAMIAAIAGVIVGAVGGISSTMGVFGLSVLVVVIVGGLDSVLGALVAGLLIGVVESLAGGFLGGEYKLLATFLILIVVLLVRPYGLFGTHEIERL